MNNAHWKMKLSFSYIHTAAYAMRRTSPYSLENEAGFSSIHDNRFSKRMAENIFLVSWFAQIRSTPPFGSKDDLLQRCGILSFWVSLAKTRYFCDNRIWQQHIQNVSREANFFLTTCLKDRFWCAAWRRNDLHILEFTSWVDTCVDKQLAGTA